MSARTPSAAQVPVSRKPTADGICGAMMCDLPMLHGGDFHATASVNEHGRRLVWARADRREHVRAMLGSEGPFRLRIHVTPTDPDPLPVWAVEAAREEAAR